MFVFLCAKRTFPPGDATIVSLFSSISFGKLPAAYSRLLTASNRITGSARACLATSSLFLWTPEDPTRHRGENRTRLRPFFPQLSPTSHPPADTR